MSIVSSDVVLGTLQRDGRRHVTETHVDNVGISYTFTYLAAVDANTSAILAARAVTLAQWLINRELEAELASDSFTPLVYGTKTQLADAFRARYKDATALEAARMATWLLNRIDEGTFTDAQVQSAFGLTTNQYNNQKAILTTLRANYVACLAAVGA